MSEIDLVALSQEPLDPELAMYTEETDFGTVLQHPLVYAVPLVVPGLYNEMFKRKREALAAALAKDDWHTVVFLHERPHRYGALAEYDLFGDLPLVRKVWTDTENAWQNIEGWSDFFHGMETEDVYKFMDPSEWAVFDALPTRVEVYRGAWHGRNERGLSWTLDREKAIWFAQRLDRDNPLLLSGEVYKHAIKGYDNSRGEEEIIALPDYVSIHHRQVVELP